MSNPTYDFEGQVALVTGASSGMGLATARAFARAGASVDPALIPQEHAGNPRLHPAIPARAGSERPAHGGNPRLSPLSPEAP
jgi:NAD(P)-dependent dehydrogenase (short-subunit alcohol dehydrogenase family)